MTERFDLIVIGTGTGGSIPAQKCRASGWSVAVVDERPFGGTCALRGCDPKKVLVGAAELMDWNTRFAREKIFTGSTRIDWPALMRFKKTFTEPVPDARKRSFENRGIETFHGTARFVDRNTLQVGERTLTGRHIVIATGAEPRRLDIPGEDLLTYSDEFLELEELPPRILFAGGGYISFEFAHVAARAGAQVQLLHRSDRPLHHFDPDLVQRLLEATRSAGIEVRLETPVRSIERQGISLIVHAGSESQSASLETDMVVHGAGRVPALGRLALDATGVEWDARGVRVNEYLESVSNPTVYAAGDSAGTGLPPLTPTAGAEAHAVAANLLRNRSRRVDAGPVPSVVFTVPPLASVGMMESEAQSQGLRFRIQTGETSGWYSSRRIAEEHSAYKVLIEEETDRILGAHLLGEESAELINIFALAMRAGITARDLKRTTWAYPTRSSDISYMV